MPLFVPEPRSEVMSAWIAASDDTLLVSTLAIAELGSAVARRCRMGQLSEADADMALDAFDAWVNTTVRVIDHQPSDVRHAVRLVRRPQPKLLTADAIHLTTCRRLGCALVTDDQELKVVAIMEDVEVIAP